MTAAETPPTASPGPPLRKGWTTGACAAAAAGAAARAVVSGAFPDRAGITLPRGERPDFALVEATRLTPGESARAAVVKDAGDDPDVTHGATIRATVTRAAAGSGVAFHAGPGVGTVTRAGLPLAVGEPAINPRPRAMIAAALAAAGLDDAAVTIAIDNGEVLAGRTWNPRLGIAGGLSVLGTTGVVEPYSCAAWIASIKQGIDVARANGTPAVALCTGRTSEGAAVTALGLAPDAAIDAGGFIGAALKYLRRHPLPAVCVAGGVGKIAKLAQGADDLHSKRSRVDVPALAALADGVTIDGIRYGRIQASLDRRTGANAWLTVGIKEGKNREVRRLMEYLDLKVTRLIRTAFGPFQLGNLKPGRVEEVERKVLKDQLGRDLWARLAAGTEEHHENKRR